jgi:NADH-ubiquinone oxidoreductase chain 4
MLNIVSIIYTSLITLRQIDMKKIIAYSSIGHMNIAMIGILSFDIISISGSILFMIGHGFVSGGLFFIVGVLYDRYKTKIIFYYSGLTAQMPITITFMILFFLSNISMPGTSNFVGEFLILYKLVNDISY